MKNEYDFVWTQEYQNFVDEVLITLEKEYPLVFRKISKQGSLFECKALIIHAINYSRQLKLKPNEIKK